MKVAEARKLIGKPVSFRNLKAWDSERWRKGIVEEVRNRNIQIQGDWLWLPDLIIKEVEVGS